MMLVDDCKYKNHLLANSSTTIIASLVDDAIYIIYVSLLNFSSSSSDAVCISIRFVSFYLVSFSLSLSPSLVQFGKIRRLYIECCVMMVLNTHSQIYINIYRLRKTKIKSNFISTTTKVAIILNHH